MCEFSAYVAFNKQRDKRRSTKRRKQTSAECHCWRSQLKSSLPRKDRIWKLERLFKHNCTVCIRGQQASETWICFFAGMSGTLLHFNKWCAQTILWYRHGTTVRIPISGRNFLWEMRAKQITIFIPYLSNVKFVADPFVSRNTRICKFPSFDRKTVVCGSELG